MCVSPTVLESRFERVFTVQMNHLCSKCIQYESIISSEFLLLICVRGQQRQLHSELIYDHAFSILESSFLDEFGVGRVGLRLGEAGEY